jgi:hypothetical protein
MEKRIIIIICQIPSYPTFVRKFRTREEKQKRKKRGGGGNKKQWLDVLPASPKGTTGTALIHELIPKFL